MSSGGATVSLDLSVSEDVLPSLPEEPAHSAEWMAYLEYIDGMVLQKLTQAVQSSVDVFFEETNPDKPLDEGRPLFEVNLELKDPNIVFNPSLDDDARKGFYRLVEGLLYDVVHMSELIARVAAHNPRPHYRKDIHQNAELNNQLQEILIRVRTAIAEAVGECEKMNVHSYLWMDDRGELFDQFLRYGHYLTQDELDELAAAEEGTTPIRERPPDLDKFKELIELYEGLYKELDEIPTEKVFQKWFRVNIKPFKQALLNTVCKWSSMIKQHLVDHVINSLRGLAEFNEEAERELSREVKEGDYAALLAVMNYLGKVRDRRAKTDTMFEPIKETIELLKTYDVEFPEEIYVQLQELPDAWNNVKKIAIAVRTAVSPLITHEMNQIRRRITILDARQLAYREAFKKMPFFRFDCENCYDDIDQAQQEICELEEYIAKISQQAALFEVNVPDFRGVKMCRKEIKMIKQLWDYVNVVRSSLDEWKTTPWREIDVDNMDMECKKFGKELRTLDKEMRGWDTFISLEALLKNMVTSLRAVSELQNPAIRERHWRQLMAATKVKIVINEHTVLDDLLQLNLHLFEDEVKTIVDKSVKEMSMEKVLRELDATWREQEFEREEHPRTGVQLIRTSEELIETLEENQVQLQNMMGSKFIAFFLTEVSEWQSKLGNADAVISIWMEVQRTWCHLESIFVGSEDIRSQLPEDCRRFDMVDVEFKKLLEDLTKEPNIVRFTNKKGLYEKLEELQAHLTKCEKALAEYLETKRLAYPRFYFVSSADLLDILSNGNQPAMVARHLTKLYDSMAKLKMDSNSKMAIGMWAKDGEYVQFSQKCDCDGKVEVWLNRVTDSMRVTGRHYFGEAVAAYDEKPREQWIFDYPAQTALVGTQIWWTTEVNIAFSRLEEGYENALKDYNRKQVQQLNTLIGLLLGDLSAEDRQKIMTICTIDVHSRDVVGKMIAQKVESSTAFQWQSQLRHRWDDRLDDCFCNICDAQFRYDYEYLGCTPRLVITPLTDRCYITLTQSLHLIMGGAPAGPAGTGKTETTKDLGRAMGVMVYVFNCSEQMDYKSCGNIYKGLAQTGAWGCFDEFNRISVEVLSVVAVQVKTVLDAIRFKKTRFSFMGETITLTPTVGMFITMNPGYAGRTELPENLKVLFRPCAMVVPDFELICEIMLVAEGFQEARLLARKFITLYTLCRELLSKQDHYDWGLRAIKSVLVVAGSLKRGDRQRPEDQVLMRALRDFNVPKIVTDDLPVFMGLIGDLFPALDVPRKRDLDFEKAVRQAATDLQLQPEDNFILKVVQLVELLEVRHSVFIIGFAGTGKSMVWKTLFKTYQNMRMKPFVSDLNPKAVTNDELFGVINPSTREWKDGLFSVLMRDIANMSGDGPRWIMLDGDIDPMWIESLNTVMDDNKVLTLASNERIAMTKSMRLLFEISNLRTATPATVSRAGILYINPTDLGWNPYVTSWIDKRDQPAEKANLLILFDKYVPPTLEALRTKFKKITPVPEIAHVKMLCDLLDCFLTDKNLPPECPKEWYEIYFVFSCVWAFGSVLFQDQLVDWRNEFHKWWVSEFKVVKFPPGGTVFNYFIDPDTKKFLSWSESILPYEFDPDTPLQATLVSTAETTRLRVFMDLLLPRRIPVMLVGGAGSGKSVIVNGRLAKLPDSYMVTNVPFNFYTTSEMLQKVLEKPLEKKAGRNYGPPGNKSMIYFIDDMNMPEVDKYFTVQPHTLIRQHLDYNHWYDRGKLTLKDIHNCQYVSCMNPTAGSFTIDPRLQRHFFVFAVSFPGEEALNHIYTSILQGHLSQSTVKFNPAVSRLVPSLVQSALFLHAKMTTTFLPTAVKFHYLFNLRDLANVFQGILFSTPDCIPDHSALVRLWVHEATRVYHDKLVDDPDRDMYKKLLLDAVKKIESEPFAEGVDEAAVLEKPIIYVHFAEGIGETKYLPIASWEALNKLLLDALLQYNDMVASMNLVLFEDAMDHICRISRILMAPRGNALLVGVGGSGKQSLTRLAAFICNLDVFQVQLRKGYAIADLKAELAVLYQKAGLKSAGLLFLMTDAQVPDERFLVIINDMLASGEIPDLFADDEVENIINQMRGEVKGIGMQDTRENCWKFFINRVRSMLKTVLCFSPVGATLRMRSRKFPAITNCTAINWFNEWPYEALQSVSLRFLAELDALPENLRKSVSEFMSFVHASVNEMSQAYLVNERRYNYTTPKSFLEQIELYGKLLTNKSNELSCKIVRLQNGLEKLASCGEQVDGLKEVLAVQEVEVRQKNAAADELIVVVSKETEKVSKEKAIAAEEERKVMDKEEEVSAQRKLCEQDLKAAEPALIAASEALNTLNKNNLTELKALASPPAPVMHVLAAAMVLLAPKGKVPKERGWKEAKAFMGKVDTFLDNLLHYDKENIHPDVVKAIKPYLANKEFVPELIKTKSTAAAGLCAWCINIMAFHEVYVNVEPKRRALNEKNAEWMAARQRLAELKSKLDVLEGELAVLTEKFEVAVAEKLKCQEEADSTAETIDLANRLVHGLGSESVRWQESIANFQKQGTTLPGDMLLVTAFISYVGGFSRAYRVDLQEKKWLPFLKTLNPAIPLTEDLDPLSMLTDDAQVAAWNNEGLPNDSMSIENATIIMNSARWPLLIDPQLQGIKWIKTRYGKHLKVVRLGQKSYMDVIERAISRGKTVLIEFIGESVDAVLEPLLSRALINKGRAIKMGDKEIDYNPKFRLILQTKLANPHYKPEMQAQTTIINFTVTRDGLEEQLLAEVVKAERPDLESLRMELTTKQNSYKIEIKNLEDELLQRLSSAGDNVLSDKALVLNLERTKRTAEDIVVKVEESKVTGKRIDEAREHYRPAASRAALLYFILNDLHKINPVYQFSLKAYTVVFHRGIQLSAQADTLQARVHNLIDSITYQTYIYTSRGLFEADKLIFMTQMAVQMEAADKVLLKAQEVEPVELDFLLRYPFVTNLQSPVDFLSDSCWGGIVALSSMLEFKNLDKDIEGAAKRWRTFVESEAPEKEKFPGDWKGKTALQRLCMMRALRPDRMIYATQAFIEEKLGSKFIESRSVSFEKSFEESSPTTPVFFILSPGVDPLKDVEKLGRKMGFTSDKHNFHNVSLGQGQEPVAEKAMKRAAKKGHWVILQNIHLVANWLPSLEKRMDKCAERPHDNYRLFMSAEPAPAPEFHILPQGVLESSIKITNEPPTGMHANLHKALDNFSQETLEMSTKEAEFKSILFALCYFHAVVAERRKFAAQGWNRVYPFNFGDLTISVNVLYNYLEANSRVPWEDLRYLFGEIMYGGHITDDWDRRLCATYLEEYLQAELVDGDLVLAPGFTSPPNSDYASYHQYIDDYLPPESPMLYGLHPNAEISSLTATSEKLFKTVFEMQPRDAMAGSGVTVSREEKVKQMLSDILERLPEAFNMAEMMGKVEDRTPYVIVAFQECERMNQLMAELRQSLTDLDLGLKGELTITTAMENLEQCLFVDKVPENWSAKAYPSMLPLSSWFADLQLRLKELENWTQDFIMPGSVWLAGFFNPQSFLTAIMQSMARKNEWPLDKMCLQCDVTKKGRDDFSQAPREGANVHGLYMEGARWDVVLGCVVDSRHKELFPMMPVIYVRAITQDKQETRNVYQCPVYKTRQRGPTFVWTFNLKTRDKPTKWTLAGTALLLST
ncbi:hypothetical protein ONE63_006052 [Megalurothrips usitatus]|uniref:Dynein beta chain, ciliary n=1 Tax=Megalurothrips usitatus TaxID=439358 RepID=A0AAV7XS54_9NEOP|nr:hypothetical protein ONE63_006052 [Megalurothrips usitatus]